MGCEVSRSTPWSVVCSALECNGGSRGICQVVDGVRKITDGRLFEGWRRAANHHERGRTKAAWEDSGGLRWYKICSRAEANTLDRVETV